MISPKHHQNQRHQKHEEAKQKIRELEIDGDGCKEIKASFMINLYDVFCHSTAACILEGAPPVDLPLLVPWCLSVNRTPNSLVSHQVDRQKKVETIIIPSDVQKAGKVSSEIEHQRK